MKHLPRKPSRLIRLALKDLVSREADPRYAICMGGWHEQSRGVCTVCFAGATFARLGATPDQHLNHKSFGPINQAKFIALNYFRTGLVREAFFALNLQLPRCVRPYREMPSYDLDPAGFKRAMERLADCLEKVSC